MDNKFKKSKYFQKCNTSQIYWSLYTFCWNNNKNKYKIISVKFTCWRLYIQEHGYILTLILIKHNSIKLLQSTRRTKTVQYDKVT